ncbi:hypothetical protein BH11CYA1_BH11CYA1_43610 [soil metagenome]
MNYNSLAICILCLLGSAWFGSQWYFHKTGANSSRDWYCVSGKLQVVTIEKINTYVGTRGRSETYHVYTPHVSYSYTYKGQQYRGDVVSFPNPTFNTLKESKSFQSKYAEGSAVTIWFDPKAPERSCLSPGLGQSLGSELLFAIVLLVIGVFSMPLMSFNKSDEQVDKMSRSDYAVNPLCEAVLE